MEIKLGEKVKDIVSGHVGIAIARTEFLNGCIQYQVQTKISSKEKESKICDVDIEQLEKVDSGIIKKKKVTNTGGLKGFNIRNATRTL